MLDMSLLLSGANPAGVWAETTSSGTFNPVTTLFDVSGLTPAIYSFTYTTTGIGNVTDVADFDVTVIVPPNAGLDSTAEICNGPGSTLNIGTLLFGADDGGQWLEQTSSLMFTPSTAILDADGLAAGNYIFLYIVESAGECSNDTSFFDITVNQQEFAGLDSTITRCNISGNTINLSSLLSGADPGGTWNETTASGAFNPGTAIFDVSGLTAAGYTFTYIINATAPCLNDTANFTVLIEQEVFAGNDSIVSACNSIGTIVNMTMLLSGADAGGVWTETSASGAFNVATAILNTDGLAAGPYTFTYDVTGNAPCLADQADFTVTVVQEPTAGLDSTISTCNIAGSTIDLSTLFNGADAGGILTETTSSGALNTFSWVLNVSGLTAGTYNFIYVVSAPPCSNDTASFTVIVEQEVFAGNDSIVSACNAAGTFLNLATLLSGADASGVWTETSASGAFNVATTTLNTDGLTAGPYTFTYNVTGNVPCSADQADFTVNVVQDPSAGLDSSISTCNIAGSTINLSTLLNGADLGGAWTETTASAAFNSGTAIFSSGGLAAGTYSFVYVLSAPPCLNDTANISVIVEQEVFAGNDSTVSACNVTGTILNLATLLSGADTGGIWSETSSSGTFNPGTATFNTGGLAAGAYTFTYTVPGNIGCLPDQADFTVNVLQSQTAGLDNTISTCNIAGSSINLSTLLSGADPGGTWAEITASGTFNSGTAIFSTGGLTAGTYNFVYVLSAPPCINDTANISVVVEQEVFAGNDSIVSSCNVTGTFVNLTTLLSGADAGGVWAETTVSGAFNAGTATLNTGGLTAGAYTFTYTVPGNAGCLSDQADFTVNVSQSQTAGLDSTISACNITGSTLNLLTLLNGADPGGTWTEMTASGAFNSGTAVLSTGGLTAGTYNFVYVLSAPPCINDTANISVVVEQEVFAGNDSVISVCNEAGSFVDLGSLLSGADAGGVWTETSASGAFNIATATLNTDGLAAGNYTFTYDVTGNAPCPADQADFTVNVVQELTAGQDSTISTCNVAGSAINLSTLLNGADSGGNWVETTASGTFNALTAVFDVGGLVAGSYNFIYVVSALPCLNDTAFITVNVDQQVFAGMDNSITACDSIGSMVDMNVLLSGADAGGLWFETSASGAFNSGSAIFDAGSTTAGTYTFIYVVTSSTSCLNDTSNFSIQVLDLPLVSAGLNVETCEGEGVILFGSGAEPNGIYVWNNGVSNGQVFMQAIGTQTYSVTGTDIFGCTNNSSVDVTVHPNPDVLFEVSTQTGCDPLPVSLSNLTPNTGQFCEWQFGDNTFSSECDSVIHTYLQPGSYNVGLTVTSIYGCTGSSTIDDFIYVEIAPVASFDYTPTDIDVMNTEVHFDNNSSYATSYLWNFGDLSQDEAIENPSHFFPEIGESFYYVTLVASNDLGCADSTVRLVEIQDILLFYIPNTFTPDQNDYNNEFKPIFTSGFNAYEYHLLIFNRWGEIVFESFDSEMGWDGTYLEGNVSPKAVYIWQVEYKKSKKEASRESQRGYVTLLR